jgi:hypothetical protein
MAAFAILEQILRRRSECLVSALLRHPKLCCERLDWSSKSLSPDVQRMTASADPLPDPELGGSNRGLRGRSGRHLGCGCAAVEDASAALADLKAHSESTIAGSVVDVTADDPNLDKSARRTAAIASAAHESPAAAFIKSADKFSNVRSILSSPPGWHEKLRVAYP